MPVEGVNFGPYLLKLNSKLALKTCRIKNMTSNAFRERLRECVQDTSHVGTVNFVHLSFLICHPSSRNPARGNCTCMQRVGEDELFHIHPNYNYLLQRAVDKHVSLRIPEKGESPM